MNREQMKTSRIRRIAALSISLALAPSLASAACNARTVDAKELNGLVIVRCAPTSQMYPCFEAQLSIANGAIVNGKLNAVRAVGLHGQYDKPAGTQALENLISALNDADIRSIAVSPASKIIDGKLDMLLLRACGKTTSFRTEGEPWDAEHLQWLKLLDQIEALVLNMNWQNTATQPDYKQMRSWFAPDFPQRAFAAK